MAANESPFVLFPFKNRVLLSGPLINNDNTLRTVL